MTHEPDGDDLADLRERQHAARCLMRVAYDRLDAIAGEVEAATRGGGIALRPELLVALSEAEHAARAAAAEMKDAAYALGTAGAALTGRQRSAEDEA